MCILVTVSYDTLGIVCIRLLCVSECVYTCVCIMYATKYTYIYYVRQNVGIHTGVYVRHDNHIHCTRYLVIIIIIVSATALIHRTARHSISAMSSLLGISPKCVQLVMIWFRSHVAAPHIGLQCLFSGSPTDVSLPGWQPLPSALGWPSAMYATAVCHHSGVVLLDGCHISSGCSG